jgi:hypothetical protein
MERLVVDFSDVSSYSKVLCLQIVPVDVLRA